MGCFVSTHKSTASAPFTKSNRSPPHPLEETVKEVLSETPKQQPTIPKIFEEPKRNTPLLANIQEEQENETHFKNKPKMVNTEETSEVSEIYSTMSESFSTTTERRENEEDGEARQRVDRSPAKFKRRSLSGDLSSRRERGVAKSPARSEPSPGRVRSVPGRERRWCVPDGKGGDIGESSGRRSRSPAIGTDGGGTRQSLGRSPSVRKTGKSPCRGRSDLAEKNRKVERGSKGEGKWPPTSNESLENPLVSLECFIFL